MNASGRAGELRVSLDCSYAGTFYVQFVSGDCMSDVAMVTTDECKYTCSLIK